MDLTTYASRSLSSSSSASWLLLLLPHNNQATRERAQECAGQEGEKDEGVGDKGRARVCCDSPLKHCLFVD